MKYQNISLSWGFRRNAPLDVALIKLWIKFVLKQYQRIVKTYFKEITKS